MDILVITWNYPPRRGGIENVLENLCSSLRKKQQVFVITSFDKARRLAEADTFRAPLHGLIPFAFYALWRGAMVLARNRQIPIVFGGSALVTPLVLILARLFRRRTVVQTHGLDVVHRDFFYQLLCVRWLKYCDRVVANSNYTAALVKSKRVAPDRLTVIPPGVQPERFSIPTDVVATKRRWNIEGGNIILLVGRLAKRKGVKEFIERSLVEIVREVPAAVFLIVGDNPTEALVHRDNVVDEIQTAVSRSGLEKQVRLLGGLSDDEVTKLYHACDLVVLPALDTRDDIEGFGIVALEASAAGKPIVATRVGGIPDAVEEGKSGVLVDPGDYIGFSRIIVSLLKDGEKSFSMGSYGRYRVNKYFAWRRISGFYGGMFDALTRDAS